MHIICNDLFFQCKLFLTATSTTSFSLTVSFEGQHQEYYGEATLTISNIEHTDLQSSFSCVAMNEMGNTRSTVTLRLKEKCKDKFCFMMSLAYFTVRKLLVTLFFPAYVIPFFFYFFRFIYYFSVV